MARKRAATEPANEAAAEEQVAPIETSRDGERQYPPQPNPFSWEQNEAAGVQYRTRREPYQSEIAFKEKPSPEVIALVKDNGFRWDGQDKIWTRPIAFASQAQDRLTGSRTYQKAVNMILDERGLEPESGQSQAPF